MINKIISSAPQITVFNGEPKSPELNYELPQNKKIYKPGDVRFNPETKNLEVFDSDNWVVFFGNTTYINLEVETLHTLVWAKGRMQEEEHIKEMAQVYPTIEDAWQHFKLAESQLRMLIKLVEKDVGEDG